tara:strand:+ start:100 stop:705 length:606 start_codon:yes stop_codon:yes gene_type:complete
MKKLLFILLVAMSCGPPFHVNQSAKLIDESEIEVTPGVSFSTPSYVGFQIGYGISDTNNLIFRYEHGEGCCLKGSGFKVNYLSIGPKTQYIKDRLSFYYPLSLYVNKKSVFLFEPTLLYTKSFKYLEFNPSYKILIGSNEYIDVLTLGFGLSTNLDKWIFRTELGCLGFGKYLLYNSIKGNYLTFCAPQLGFGLSVKFSDN